MKKPTAPLAYERALLLCCELCAKCEQCAADLREKLRKKLCAPADIDRVMDYLYDHNFLNDRRFARAYALDKFRFNSWGRIKLTLMLRAKRIAAADIAYALEQIDETDYRAKIMHLLRLKATPELLASPAGRQKLVRSIYAKGFELELIYQSIKELKQKA